MDVSEQGPDDEHINNPNLEILKNYWTRHVQESILSTWMNKDKRHFSQAECKVINDTFVESFNLIESLNPNNAAQFAEFLQKINTIWTLMNKSN
jgi:hypothetical protein